MESFKLENLSFTYPKREKKAIDTVSFTVNRGEFLLICGRSGCGKTTLLRLLKPAISPFGTLCGNIYFEGKPLLEWDEKEQAARIGFVMQNPESQIVTDKVWHELAFGLESLGYKTPEIRARVSEMASFFGLESWFHKNVSELSGGQKQLLNLAAVMVMQPSVLILDEPTSQLDPISAAEFLKALEKINRELGVTVILTEHRLEDAFPQADKVIVLDGGKIVSEGTPEMVGKTLHETGHSLYKALPTPMRVHGAVPNHLPCPVHVKDGRLWLEAYGKESTINPDAIPADAPEKDGETVIEIREAWFRYEKNAPDVIRGLNLRVKKGELYCIVGGNGTGKTTALSLIAGLNTPQRGDVYIKGMPLSKVPHLYGGVLGVLPQNPQSVFLKNTVFLDLVDMLSAQTLSKEEKEKRVKKVATFCEIDYLLNMHPYDLSGGEQQRTALAKILLTDPEILLLDEPTKGMDAHFKAEFARILAKLKASGKTVIMVSHDIEFCAEYADRCALFFDGSITSEGAPRAFFSGKNFYTTAANRMARTSLPHAVLAEDIIRALGGSVKENEEKPALPKVVKTKQEETKVPKATAKRTKKRKLSPLFILLLIPLTIYIGTSFLDNRKYYFISLLMILETIFAFFLSFESRKPKARELITISVLCAIGVIGRAAFFMVPQFKPTLALVILSGVCFGGEAGFLVGAVTSFVSNFFFGQGPWTPWQMFAFGIIGFLAGILFKKGFIPKRKGPLSIFGMLSALVLYGGIMNPASIIMWQDKIKWEMIAASFAAGLPLDIIHGLSTAFFLWVLSGPMIEKLERVKIKYGLD